MISVRTSVLSLTAAGLALGACGGQANNRQAEVAAPGSTEAMAEDAIEAHKENFEAISKTNKAIKSQLDSDQADLAAVAASAADIAARGERIVGYFPAGTGPGSGEDTEALSTIWEKPDEFRAAAEKLITSARALEGAARAGNLAASKAAAQTLGASCKGCHDSFRAKKS